MQNSDSTAPAPTALFPETRHCRALFPDRVPAVPFSRFRGREDRKENKHK